MELTIGKAAREAGVNVETIRFYERRCLIEQPRKAGGQAYRRYPPETIARIRFIQKAQELGFSLQEIQDLLSLVSKQGADCGDVRARAAAKIEAVTSKIADLVHIREALERVVAACPGGGNALENCAILEALGTGCSCHNQADESSA